MKEVEALGGKWTIEMLDELKSLRSKAIEEKETVFLFQKQEVDTSFAKYLIEYLESEFGIKPTEMKRNVSYNWLGSEIKKTAQ